MSHPLVTVDLVAHAFDVLPPPAPPTAPVPDVARLLEGLNDAQRSAVCASSPTVCILAGAGSGKTRVLTRRIAYRIATGRADPRHVLAITFTRKAAGELSARLASLGVRPQVAAGTFHAVAFAQLRRRWAERGERTPALLDRKTRLLVPLLASRLPGVERHMAAVAEAGDVATEIEWAKARMVSPARYEAEVSAAGRRPPLPAPVIASLYERYEEDKRRRGLVDFDDLLVACALALETDAVFAASQRWRFRHLFVDEFQDVNPVQYRLLEAWRGGRPDICVVGDPDQAIYGWNGADATALTGFAARHPGTTVVRLEDNYRSSPQVLAVANAIRGRPRGGPGVLRPHADDGPEPTVRSFPSDADEAQAVARSVREAHLGSVAWSHLAVLARTNAQLVLFEEALRAARVPYRVRGSSRFLDQPRVRQAVAELRRRPTVPLSSVLADLEDEAAGEADGGGDHSTGPPGQLDGMVRLAREHLACDPDASVDRFLRWMSDTLRGEEPDGAGDAVDLATFHASKGLEWPVVFLTGLERGLVPIGHAETGEARAEERRLLYVAVTRARRRLQCSWAERRTFGTRTMARSPSPWLPTVEAAIAAAREGPDVDWRRFLADGREQLRATPARGAGVRRAGEGADRVVLEALKSWRRATAKASGVPAHVLFHDSTLAAVAEAKPRATDDLLALPGVGPVKARRYGDQLLAVVASADRPGD